MSFFLFALFTRKAVINLYETDLNVSENVGITANIIISV
jgi:hypothetical protein